MKSSKPGSKDAQSTAANAKAYNAGKAAAGKVADSIVFEEKRERGKSKRQVMKEGGIVRSKDPRTAAGGVTVKEWQRLPKQLVQEWAQREKRPRAFFPRAQCKDESKFRVRCILPDAKKKEKDLAFCSNENWNSITEAEEWVSLLALKHVTPALPLERKLPSPYAEGWLSLSGPNPMVTNERAFVSAAEHNAKVEQRKQKTNEIDARKEARLKALPQVFMSEDNRRYIEQIIETIKRSSMNKSPPIETSAQSKPATLSAATSAAVKKLIDSGFASGDVNRAVAVEPSADFDALLSWLLIHLPESSLPAKYDPRGTQFEVMKQGGDSAQYWTIMYGVPKKLYQKIRDAKQTDELIAASICNIVYLSVGATEADESAESWDTDPESAIAEEISVLESIYGPDCVIISPRRLSLRLSDALTIELWASEASGYPQKLPVILIHAHALSGTDRLQLLMALASYAKNNGLIGRPCLYDICAHLQSSAEEMIEQSHNTPINEPEEFDKHSNLLTSQQRAAIEAHLKHSTEGDASDSQSGRKDRTTPMLSLKPNSDVSARLKTQLDKQRKESKYLRILETRQSLPMYTNAAQSIKALESNRAILVTAATGAGKSTQFPSLLLDHYIDTNRGAEVNIVCTQPRRISAIGLATRVAEERADQLGGTVGFRIKNESKVSSSTRLSFVTGGILLRQICTNPASLYSYSHVLVDEVHERSVEIDTLLLILKRAVSSSQSKLRVVLMSATLDAERITKYFNDCPAFDTPGRAFPVTNKHLEDVLQLTGYVPGHRHRSKGVKAEELQQRIKAMSALYNVRGRQQYDDNVLSILATLESREIDCDMICATVEFALEEHPEGAVLVFLPSVETINTCLSLTRNRIKSRGWNESNYQLYPLHAQLPPGEQAAVFRRPPSGSRKVIFSTNVAETSVTIDDITVVIDSGKMKSMEFDASRSMSALVETFVAQSNAIQRTGRAGRVQAGTCYRCYTSQQFAQFNRQQIPEIHRVALDQLCLQLPNYATIGLDPAKANQSKRNSSQFFSSILNEFIDPPAPITVKSALFALNRLGTIRGDDVISTDPHAFLTPLGRHISLMPVSSTKIGRMLIMSAAFECVSSIAVVAAFLVDRPPFINPSRDDRQAFDDARKQFTHSRSDHLTWLRAYQRWTEVMESSGEGAARRFCQENFLHHVNLLQTRLQAKQFKQALEQSGFVDTVNCDRNSADPSVVLAALCSGLYPSVAQIKLPVTQYQSTAHGAAPLPFKAQQIRYFVQHNAVVSARQQATIHNNDASSENIAEVAEVTPEATSEEPTEDRWDDEDEETAVKPISVAATPSTSSSDIAAPELAFTSDRTTERVFLHPRSVNFTSDRYESLYLIYHELVQTSKQFVVDCSQVPAYALLLFGGSLTVEAADGVVRVDDWIQFRAAPRICALVMELRTCLDRLLEQKLHSSNLPIHDSPIIAAAIRLIRSSGF